ncbi:MAG: FecR family protein [Chitinophaga rupis]
MEKVSLIRLIEKYLNNSATPEEYSALMTWYRSAHRDIVEWPASTPDEEQQVRARMLQQIRERMLPAPRTLQVDSLQPAAPMKPVDGMSPASRLQRQIPPARRISLRRGLTAAAVLFIICTVTLLVLQRRDKTSDKWISLNNPAGKIQKVDLPDGSEIWLNANSRLRYRQNFKVKRELELEGEAFFKVRPVSGSPFQVHSRGLITEVLGTAFNVDAYKNEQQTLISVQSGKVAVRSSEKAQPLAYLSADQEIVYNPATSKSLIRKTLTGNGSWINGKWQFQTATLEEITGQLENWYGVRFSFTNPALKACQYTATFDNSIQLKDLLTLLCEINNIHFDIDENRRIVTLSGQGCQ